MRFVRRTRLVARSLLGLALLQIGLLPDVIPSAAIAASPATTLSRGTAGPDDSLAIAGSGFQANDALVVFATFMLQLGTNVRSTQRVMVSSHVTGAGSFRASLTVPSTATPGISVVTAQDTHGHTASISP